MIAGAVGFVVLFIAATIALVVALDDMDRQREFRRQQALDAEWRDLMAFVNRARMEFGGGR